MGKELDELRREYAENEAKLQQYQHRAKRLEQRKQYYEKGERQKHVHRLITRGATVPARSESPASMGRYVNVCSYAGSSCLVAAVAFLLLPISFCWIK